MGGPYDTLTKGWYTRQVSVDPSAKGKELYLVFEGAASIADVYVNGQHLGQLRGAYSWPREDEVAFKSTGRCRRPDRPLPPLIKYGQG